MLCPKREKILLFLDEVEMATREQIQKIVDIGGVRWANRIMRDLHQEGYLHKIFNGKNVYYLSEKGRGYIGSKNVVKNNNQTTHRLMRTDIYIQYQPEAWAVERAVDFTFKENVNGMLVGRNKTIVPDARFQKKGKQYFVEIDNEQDMKQNKKKVELYRNLFPVLQKQLSKPILIVYTRSEVRKEGWKGMCKDIPCVILTPRDIM
ncbi:replication-relaxation family protein [Sutcliffiella cohnii]